MIREQIRIWGTVFAALLGLAFGSFLNVCLSRWPTGESIVTPRSHCRHCLRGLKWWENVPLLSWLALRGRCRGCGAWIGWRYVIVEAAVGGLWAMAAWRFLALAFDPDITDISPFLHFNVYNSFLFAAGMMIFYWLIIALAVLDAEHLWLPDRLTFPGIVLGLVCSVTYRVVRDRYSDGPLPLSTTLAPSLIGPLTGVVVAAALILLIRWVYWLIRRKEGIGLGDAKLMAMLAAWLGLPAALLSFAIAVLLGSAVALIVLVLPKQPDRTEGWALLKLPLGTFLCIGGIVSGLWGQQIIAAYLQWAGF